MSGRIGTFRRMFINLRNSLFYVKQKDRLVGTDQFGNRYFEREGDKKHDIRKARYIEERKDLDKFDAPEIPVEWSAWLRGRRKDPPTPEEIERNEITMMKTKLRAAELEKKFSAHEPTPLEEPAQKITEDIKSNPKKTPFPVYEGFEIAPGQKAAKK